jgi:hypothetical protein
MTVAQLEPARNGLGGSAASSAADGSGSSDLGDSDSDIGFRRKRLRGTGPPKRGAVAGVRGRGRSARPAPPRGRPLQRACEKCRRRTPPKQSSSSTASIRNAHGGGSSSSAHTHREPGRDSDATSVGSVRSSDGAAAPAAAGLALPPREQLKAATMDRRQRRRLDCDPVVRISHIFEYGACSAAAASAAPVAQVEHQYVFAYRYVPVPGMDAYDELGSRDFTVRECVAREAVILPVADLVQLRRNVPAPK